MGKNQKFEIENRIFTDSSYHSSHPLPSETTWDLLNVNNTTIIGSGGPYSQAGTLHTESVCLEYSKDCYNFTIYDSYGDGICCSYGNGNYTVYYEGTQAGFGGDFGSSETTSFCGSVPDLEIYFFNVVPDEVNVNEEFDMWTRIRNAGPKTMEEIILWFFLNDEVWVHTDFALPDLSPGETYEFVNSKQISEEGIHNITVFVTSNDTDFDLTNNYNSSILYIDESGRGGASGPGTPLIAPPSEVAPEVVEDGEPTDVSKEEEPEVIPEVDDEVLGGGGQYGFLTMLQDSYPEVLIPIIVVSVAIIIVLLTLLGGGGQYVFNLGGGGQYTVDLRIIAIIIAAIIIGLIIVLGGGGSFGLYGGGGSYGLFLPPT